MEYHLGNCKGPCQGFQSEQDYATSIDQVKHLLKGNVKPLLQNLKETMQAEAAALAFEKANEKKQGSLHQQ